MVQVPRPQSPLPRHLQALSLVGTAMVALEHNHPGPAIQRHWLLPVTVLVQVLVVVVVELEWELGLRDHSPIQNIRSIITANMELQVEFLSMVILSTTTELLVSIRQIFVTSCHLRPLEQVPYTINPPRLSPPILLIITIRITTAELSQPEV